MFDAIRCSLEYLNEKERADALTEMAPYVQKDDLPLLFIFLGETENPLFVPVLRQFLNDTRDINTGGLRVCDMASEALDQILDIDSGLAYGTGGDGESEDPYGPFDAHRMELLKRTEGM